MNIRIKIITTLKIWIVIYPSITLFLFFFAERLASFPLYQRTFILTIILVPWMVFVAMPFVAGIIGMFSLKNVKK